jgi:hypothetical protein
MPIYGDYNSTHVFYLRSNLGSIFFQTPVDINGKKEDVMSNISIIMRIKKSFLLHLRITYPDDDDDDKNSCNTFALTSEGYIELVDANLHPVNLLYLMRLSLLVEFY